MYDDPLALIASPDVDAVVIASPGFVHEEQVLGCLEHGKPVLCEKPLTMDSASALRLLEAEVVGKRGASLRVRVLADPARTPGNGSGPGTPDDPGAGGGPGSGDGVDGDGGSDGVGEPEKDPADPDDGGGDDVSGGDSDGEDGPTLPGRGGCASGGDRGPRCSRS